jgi:hypothetical protein
MENRLSKPPNFAYSKAVKLILIAIAMLVTVTSVSAQGVLLFLAAGSLSPTPNTGAAIVPGTVNFITDIDYAPVTAPTSDAGGVEMTANTLVLTDFNITSPVITATFTPITLFPTGYGVNFISGVTYNGNPAVPIPADMKLSETQTGLSNTTISGGDITSVTDSFSPVPEPYTLTLGSLALGLVALKRLSRK